MGDMNNTIIATSSVVASSPIKFKEVPESFSYSVDIVLIVIFLVIFLFVKPKDLQKEELTEEEKPNPLEKVLRTDSDENNNESDSNNK